MWAFQRAGVSLPHSAAAQYQMGSPVAQGSWRPGDLLFWGSSPPSDHPGNPTHTQVCQRE
ncbi:MAG: NlpC/P60 family protein [Sciscionella sp.]